MASRRGPSRSSSGRTALPSFGRSDRRSLILHAGIVEGGLEPTESLGHVADVLRGPATSLADFERKARMLESESYRAIFEGFNAGLWAVNSGRMLWMTQPAWPSSAWQIFSHDYDTHAAFYGTKKASETVHVQINLPDGKVVLVNNGLADLPGVSMAAHVVGLDNRTIADLPATITGRHEAASDAFALDLPRLTAGGIALIRLEAKGPKGDLLSSNLDWQAKDDAGYRALDGLAAVPLLANLGRSVEGNETVLRVTLVNGSPTPAIETKLTVMNADGSQVLPAYFSDDYVSLLPGDSRTVEIRFSTDKARSPRITLRGWNVAPASIGVPQ